MGSECTTLVRLSAGLLRVITLLLVRGLPDHSLALEFLSVEEGSITLAAANVIMTVIESTGGPHLLQTPALALSHLADLFGDSFEGGAA